MYIFFIVFTAPKRNKLQWRNNKKAQMHEWKKNRNQFTGNVFRMSIWHTISMCHRQTHTAQRIDFNRLSTAARSLVLSFTSILFIIILLRIELLKRCTCGLPKMILVNFGWEKNVKRARASDTHCHRRDCLWIECKVAMKSTARSI